MAATERVTSFRCSKDIDKQKRVIKTKNEEQVGSPHVFFCIVAKEKASAQNGKREIRVTNTVTGERHT